MLLLTCLHLLFPRITLVWADTHYQGIKTWARENLGWAIEIVKHWWTGVSAVCRSGAAEQTFRFPCFASPLGDRANLCLDFPEPAPC